jgi:cell division septum initiation protein DivIVA
VACDEGDDVYRVFEALDELVTILEEARGVPMTSNCIVPRGDSLELLDEVRDAIPSELDDAQDVLDHKDELIGKAEHEASTKISKANSDAEATLTNAQAEAERILADAQARAHRMVAEAEQEADRAVAKGRAEYEELVGRAHAEAERMLQAGRESYEHAVEDGRIEQERMVSQTEVVHAAHVESNRILEATAAEADRQRGECDAYVDSKLAEFEELLAHTLRTVGKGRSHLRAAAATGLHASNPHVQPVLQQTAAAVPFDYDSK